MVVNIVPSCYILLLLALLTSCFQNKQDAQSILKFNSEQSFVDKRFYNQKPLAQLVNAQDYSNLSTTFILNRDENVRIYAVGEILYNLSDINKKHYLQSDDITLNFNIKEGANDERASYFKFSKAVEKEYFKKLSIDFKWSLNDPEFIAEIRIPWKTLNVARPETLNNLAFDIVIGDNDDGYIQKAKIAWKGSENQEKKHINDYGQLILSKRDRVKCNPGSGSIIAPYSSPKIDGQVDNLWSNIPYCNIERVVYGFVKDSLDLSASVKSSWDNKYLYFLIRVTDLNFKWIYAKNRSKRSIFTDEGWIEDEKGVKVWQMNPFSTSHAGGAYKNQKIDTVLRLSAGKYFLKYATDESHSFDSWDADAPLTPFYGIVLYRN